MISVFDKNEYKFLLRNKPWKILGRFFEDVKYCTQRIKRGYCDKDTWDIWSWFLYVVPPMLSQYKKERHSSPAYLGDTYFEAANKYSEIHGLEDEDCDEEWDKILSEMIHYFREADEETCSKKNKYEEEVDKVNNEFIEKYGFFGENLITEEEKKKEKKTGYTVWHTPLEIPEYQDIENKYLEEDIKLQEYRYKCKDRAFELFSKYFYDLWD